MMMMMMMMMIMMIFIYSALQLQVCLINSVQFSSVKTVIFYKSDVLLESKAIA